ncbi:glutathione s-transferase [Cryptosporidium felis]|nr:glutathione s-transferase [Cryptosporidium felis]
MEIHSVPALSKVIVDTSSKMYSPKLTGFVNNSTAYRLTNSRLIMPTKPTYRVILPVRDIGDLSVITFEHDAFVGNGGSLRFFLLGKQVRHRFINVPLDEENPIPPFVDSSKVPLGDLPIVKLGDLTIFDEIPCLRYLSKKLGEYGRNYYVDFVIDDILLRCSRWRDILMDFISGSKMEGLNQNDASNEYLSSISNYKILREQFYCEFETLISCIGDTGPFIAEKNKPMICDFILFSILFDDISLIEVTESEKLNRTTLLPERSIIHRFPRLKVLFESIATLPLIDQWIKGKFFTMNIDGEHTGDIMNSPKSLLAQDDISHLTNESNPLNEFQSSLRMPHLFHQFPPQVIAHANAGVRLFPQSMLITNNQPFFPQNNSFVSQPVTNFQNMWGNIQSYGYSSGVPSPFTRRMSSSQSFRLNY